MSSCIQMMYLLVWNQARCNSHTHFVTSFNVIYYIGHESVFACVRIVWYIWMNVDRVVCREQWHASNVKHFIAQYPLKMCAKFAHLFVWLWIDIVVAIFCRLSLHFVDSEFNQNIWNINYIINDWHISMWCAMWAICLFFLFRLLLAFLPNRIWYKIVEKTDIDSSRIIIENECFLLLHYDKIYFVRC